jgi:hypothetical protein
MIISSALPSHHESTGKNVKYQDMPKYSKTINRSQGNKSSQESNFK